ncbi:DUF4276 family protein [Lujinxingia vulgaris]|uniref:DUF4276 family protein n=1 Tax=Lujinxingia vulgaris TaxID=2600176 RepID=UPI001E50578A|nr:DUF4276 family protein [Lujinxingia vulgaris]
MICEGPTEETFVNEVLDAHFTPREIYLSARIIGKPGHKGGRVGIQRLINDVRAVLGDPSIYCTTLFDFYGLTADFPGKQYASTLPTPAGRSARLLDALTQSLRAQFSDQALRRFIPYVQMHEFEGLLFSDPVALARGIHQPQLANAFHGIRDAFATPEDINDSPQTAPSKRLADLYPPYDKVLFGSLAALEIGLHAIRAECPLFDGWLSTLEALGPSEA